MELPSWSRQALRRKELDTRPATAGAPSLTIRLAGPADEEAMARLAATDSSHTPTGEVLLAEVQGRLWAALSLDDGHSVADPFRPSSELTWMLVEHARRLRRPERSGLSRRLRLAWS